MNKHYCKHIRGLYIQYTVTVKGAHRQSQMKENVWLELSLTALLFEGHSELPGFDGLRQVDGLRKELLHVSGNVQVFTLHVGHKRLFQARVEDRTMNMWVSDSCS